MFCRTGQGIVFLTWALSGKSPPLPVEIKNKAACPRYTARAIIDVKVGSSPKWIQERLKTCGLRAINNIVDITNYVMLETGQPLHAFDGEKLAGRRIIVRFAEKGEKITTLDDQKFNLDKDILIIADEKNPVGIAGVKGGKIPEIDKRTKIVVLEAANFEGKTIRRASKKLNLKTDASLRFEHGIDPNLTEFAVNRASALIQEIAGGKIARGGLIDIYPQKILPKRVKLDLDYVERLLGIKIPEKEIRKILLKLAFKIENRKSKILNVVAPTFRIDVSLPEDLVEEIGRIYGYERIPAVFHQGTLIPPKRNFDIFWENFSKDILKEAGFSEVYKSSFVGEREASIFRNNKEKMIELENPASREQKYLRPSLIPGILKNIKSNKQYKEIKIFELGKIFFKNRQVNKKQMIEKRMLTGAMNGERFYEAKGTIDALFNKLGIVNIWYDEYKPTSEDSELNIWNRQMRAEVKIGQEEIGFLGEISRQILEESEIEQKIVVFDLDFEKLAKLCSEEREYKPISRYPAAVRDLAILVPKKVKVEEVLNIIETAGGSLLVDTDLFDIYEGEELPEDKKNLAFRLVYQAEDRTLSAKEIDEIQNKIIKELEKEPDWQVRK